MSDNPLRCLPDRLTSCNTRRLALGLTKPIYNQQLKPFANGTEYRT